MSFNNPNYEFEMCYVVKLEHSIKSMIYGVELNLNLQHVLLYLELSIELKQNV